MLSKSELRIPDKYVMAVLPQSGTNLRKSIRVRGTFFSVLATFYLEIPTFITRVIKVEISIYKVSKTKNKSYLSGLNESYCLALIKVTVWP